MMSNARRNGLAPRAALLLALSAFAFSACSTSSYDALPESLGGLPADAPKRPAERMAFPNVYQPRPTRDAKPLSTDEQKKLESELTTLRESQKQRAIEPPPPPPAPPAPAARKAAAKKKTSEKASEKTSEKPAGKPPAGPLKLTN